jgi:hypothetical protein
MLSGQINCGVDYEVEADTRAQANEIMARAIADHIEQGCDGVEINQIYDEDIELGVRLKDGALEYFDREGHV